jgi:hypothetical protein
MHRYAPLCGTGTALRSRFAPLCTPMRSRSGDSSGWIRTTDLTIMSRARAANGGATRLSEGKDLLEIPRIVGRRVWRGSPGVCATVDAWWTSSARRFACPLTRKVSATLGSSVRRAIRHLRRHLGYARLQCESGTPPALGDGARTSGHENRGPGGSVRPRAYGRVIRDRGPLGERRRQAVLDDGLRARAFRWPPLRLARIVPRARIGLCRSPAASPVFVDS